MKPLKATLLFIAGILLFVNADSQEKYSAVKIYPPADLKARAELLGLLEVDHLHDNNGYIKTEISETALSKLRASGYAYEVVVNDVADNLQRQNQEYFHARSQGLINIDGTPTAAGYGRVAFEQPGTTVGNIIVTPSAFQVQTGSPNLGGYYTFAQMNAAMDALVATYPSLASKTSIGTTVEGRNIWCIKISDNVTTDEANEPEVLYIGLQHAREAIGGSSMIFLMQYLCERYAADSRIKDLVDNREVFIIPCMNPDGWEYNRSTNPTGGGMWRKNRRPNGGSSYGVDLNRNWGIDWGNCSGASASCGSSTSTSDTYYGPSVFSEPETESIRAFTKTRNFVAMIDQHAYGPYYSLPFGRPTLHTGPDDLSTMERNYYTHIPALMGKYNGMRAGNSPQSVGYEVAGGVKDWMLRGEIGVGTKGRVFGMTGEGGYGAAAVTFWPAAAQIVNLCKGMVYQNLQLLYAAGSYVDLQDMTDIGLTTTSGNISFKVKRIGLTDAPVTVTAIPISNISFGSPVTVNTLPNYYDSHTGNINYTLPVGITNGQRIQFAWRVQTTGYTYYDTITKFYNPTVMFSDNMESGSVGTNWVVSSGWNYVVDSGYTASRALTESPGTSYPSGVTTARTARYNGTLNLLDATAAFITFQTRHRAENFRDKLQLQVSINGSTWTAIAGKTTIQEPGTLEGSTINGQPSLTGIKDDWVNEVFNLAAYLGQPSVQFRFAFTSDASSSFWAAQDEGFYIDNLKVIKSSAPLFTLAVNYISFTGKMLPSEEVLLEWQAEIDNDHSHFEVEKSADARDFTAIGRVEGNNLFNFTDSNPFTGNNYYRLKGVDFNGDIKYSKVINVVYNTGKILFMYPNPVQDELTVRLKSQSESKMLIITVSDLAGRQMLTNQFRISSQNSNFTINCSNLKPQVYILRIADTNGEVLDTQKFLKQ
ncbi:MAG: M14 family zinc carboxypeptidase [Chitinophagaceae bacterium]